MVNYVNEFRDELDEIDKLIATPELVREHAVNVLRGVLGRDLPNSYSKIVENGIASLEKIASSSLKDNYSAIYNQSCVLAVSALGAKIEKYFLNYGNYNWESIDITKKGKEIKFTLSEVAKNGYNLKQNVMQHIKDKDNSISFQDLGSTKRTFSDYFHRDIELGEAIEKQIIFYQQCRHSIVHSAGIADETFLSRMLDRDANLKGYEVGSRITLDSDDWRDIKSSFSSVIAELVSGVKAKV